MAKLRTNTETGNDLKTKNRGTLNWPFLSQGSYPFKLMYLYPNGSSKNRDLHVYISLCKEFSKKDIKPFSMKMYAYYFTDLNNK